MPGHSTHQPHGSGIRGLTSVESEESLEQIDAHEGRFGRLFPRLAPGQFSEKALENLAHAMAATKNPPKDGPDPEESHIPAAYTYLGQFIDHDLTFDPSTFQQQQSDPDGIVDFRTPRFDLDNVYGRGPSDQPFLYDGIRLLLGERLVPVERNPRAHDLPRAAAGGTGIRRAIIGDPRNDENVIVSQLHGMFLRFHNRVVDLDPTAPFEEVNREVRWHYQWVVLHDFLPRIVDASVLDAVSPAIVKPALGFDEHPPKLAFYRFDEPIMPVEFSVAAYRLGHSMVRPDYRVNEFTFPLAIFDAENPTNGLNAFGEFPKSWTIDWQRFVDLGLRMTPETKKDRVQLAYRLDTSLVEPLAHLPKSVAGDEAAANHHLVSLAFRNLLRGKKLRLPTGQDVARAMSQTVLDDKEILIGKAETGTKESDARKPIAEVNPEFAGKCPLWTYVLAEARRNFYHGPMKGVLGPVGGRIVAEVFVGLLQQDGKSFLHARPGWKPKLGKDGQFALRHLLLEALQV